MVRSVADAWGWFVGGLAEAAAWVVDRLRPSPVFSIEVGAGLVRAAEGRELGRLLPSTTGEHFEPPQLANSLAGAVIDLAVPPDWLFRRSLGPVTPESIPYLDAFVRHQIERITPWRAADVYYQIRRSPLPQDASRIAIELGLVPVRLLQPWVSALMPLDPKMIRVGAGDGPDRDRPCILIGHDPSARLAVLRRIVGLALLGAALTLAVASVWLWWQTGEIRQSLDEQDRVIEQRQAVLARTRHAGSAGRDVDAQLESLRASQVRAVDVVEALAQALPDSAHLTEFDLQKDHLAISGVSTDMAVLIPALETSGRFADVTFGAATTKVESTAADRFHLEMRVVGRPASAP